MDMRTHRLRLGLALLGALLASGCQQSGASRNAAGNAAAPARAGSELTPTLDPELERMRRLDVLITQWDATQAEGRRQEAESLAQGIRREVDSSWGELVLALRGQSGVRAQYLAVSAMGFASNPEATPLLVRVLGLGDAQLVGNALIALRLRGDPNTLLPPIVDHVSRQRPVPSRRYAPLALAAVLDARRNAALPPPPTDLEQRALLGLSSLTNDRESLVRLHTARALGSLRTVDATPSLQLLASDQDMRVRWAAAAALERRGDPRGFPDVIRLLHETAPESKSVIRDMLVSYANRLQNPPLNSLQIDQLGVGARAWTQWFSEWAASHNFQITPSRST